MEENYGFKYILQVTSSLEFLTKLDMIAPGLLECFSKHIWTQCE